MEKYFGLGYRIVPGTPQTGIFLLLFFIPELSRLLLENDTLVSLFCRLKCKGLFCCCCFALKSVRENILYRLIILALKEISGWILFVLTAFKKGLLSGVSAVGILCSNLKSYKSFTGHFCADRWFF